MITNTLRVPTFTNLLTKCSKKVGNRHKLRRLRKKQGNIKGSVGEVKWFDLKHYFRHKKGHFNILLVIINQKYNKINNIILNRYLYLTLLLLRKFALNDDIHQVVEINK